MASSSNSLNDKSYMYDVFLSFRGEDTRNNFVGHLYHALKREGIETYKDDARIEKGETINDQLINSIQHSRFFVIVFSKNYASSCWCLDELVKIMECQKTSEQTAYPVFFDVEPTEVRKQSGDFGKAFAKHINKEAAGKWIEAMKEASNLAGWELKAIANGDESELIKKVVDDIFLKLCAISLSVDENLVGMEVRIKDVLSLLEIGSNDNVRMIGIKGMGGSGKTTLARAVYDQISSEFEGRSFVENVREFAKPSLSGLKKLQKKMLTDIFNNPNLPVSSVSDGRKVMVQMMRRKKVLVVLDDVDNIKQLEALAGKPNWFKLGSIIIITTRDEQVLLSHGVSLICNVSLLTDKEAVCLFSRYAFGKETPVHGFEEMSGQVVSYADGLPLTIRVLGSFLCDKNEPEWIDTLERLKRIPLKETLEILELSYNSLEDDYKEIFLDVSCILKGERKDKAIRVLESCGFHASIGLRVLEQKSLITVSLHGELGMHDQIEEMGKNIVSRLHPSEPNKHSRLRIDGKTEDIFANEQGNEVTRCIKLLPSELNLEKFMRFLRDMKSLRVLYMCSGSNWNNIEVSQHFPDSLQYLCWRAYPFSHLSETFQAHNLVGLDMSFSSIKQLWKEGKEKVLNKLRFLDLSFTPLIKFNLAHTLNLEALNLERCTDLIELDIPYGCPKLQSLNLDYSNLKNLNLGPTPDLKTLSLVGCYSLSKLNIGSGCTKLRTLNLNNSKVRNLALIGSTPDLETLSLDGCELKELHMPFRCPKLKSLSLSGFKLRSLNLGLTSDLEMLSLYLSGSDLAELHMPDECPNLKSLSFYNSKLKKIVLGLTPNLETLNLGGCCDLVEIQMLGECPKLKSLSLCNSKLRTLDLGMIPNLEMLDLKNSYDLVEINAPSGCLKKIVYLDLSGCRRFKSFSFKKEFQSLDVGSLSELHLCGEAIDLCPLHPENNLPKWQFTCFYEEHQQSSFGNLERLISIGLCACTKLGSFSRSISSLQFLRKLTLERDIPEVLIDLNQLEYLEELKLSHAKIKNLPDSLNLRYLEVSYSKLKTLHLGITPNLETLRFDNCTDMVELHMPSECPKLITLHLVALKLTSLHLGITPNLETLKLDKCIYMVELHMPAQCPKLVNLDLNNVMLRTLDLGLNPNLERLKLKNCDLEEIIAPAECLKKLHYLGLSNCGRFKSFEFDKEFNSPEVGSLSELHLIAFCIDACESDNDCPVLRFSCFYKEDPTTSFGNIERLISLGIGAGKNLDWFSDIICGLQCLRKLTLEGSIPDAPKNLDRLGCLEELIFKSIDITHLPDSICMLKHLKSLEIKSCCLFEKLPEDIGRLECLEELCLWFTDIKNLPDSICMLKHLKSLEITYSFLLDKLPEDIGQLECVERLILTGCALLRDIPNSICEMKRLKHLDLSHCILVDQLPEDFGRLECLEELNIKGTGISLLQQSIFGSKGLRIVGDNIRRTSDETFSFI